MTKATKVMTYLPKRLLRPNHPKRDGKLAPFTARHGNVRSASLA
jgi:hypothetical protein